MAADDRHGTHEVDHRAGSLDRREMVNHPQHYNEGDIEHCEYIEDRGWAEGYYLGNATKYAHRAGHKPGAAQLQDLQKAAWYLNRYVQWLQRGKEIWKIQRKDAVETPALPLEELQRRLREGQDHARHEG